MYVLAENLHLHNVLLYVAHTNKLSNYFFFVKKGKNQAESSEISGPIVCRFLFESHSSTSFSPESIIYSPVPSFLQPTCWFFLSLYYSIVDVFDFHVCCFLYTEWVFHYGFRIESVAWVFGPRCKSDISPPPSQDFFAILKRG